MSQLTGNLGGTPEADSFTGSLTLASDGPLSAAAIVNARLLSLSGDDVIQGIALVTAAAGESAGLKSAFIDTGDDDDTLYFSALFKYSPSSSALLPAASYGVQWATILTGSGNDILRIESGLADTPFGASPAYGVYQSSLDTGDDDDRVTVTARSGFDTGPTYGLYQSTLKGGAGQDELIIESTSTGYFQGTPSYGSYQSTVDGGSGNDEISLSAYSGSRGGGTAYGALETTVLGGAGRDEITLSGSAGGMSHSRSYGAAQSLVDGGTGNDLITLSAMASGAADTQAYGLFNGRVLGGDGNDEIIISGSTNSGSNGQGIGVYRGTVNGGYGDDEITISGEHTHDNPSNVAYGLWQASVYGGAGNDIITVSGTTLAFKDSLIHGGDGNDRFEVGIGHGTVDGGVGRDLILLDFFEAQTMTVQALANNGLRITGTADAQGNLLEAPWTQTIINMEQFQVGSHLFTTSQGAAAYLQSLT
ncbi:hypothetical protein GFS31_18550 [Leptolyngbya sp. BL0902]|uniref:hypothetical protein n=1 Tax=Leptolyngbya sp. BL0902 TaxID=1115757 RepID=UPI0018E70380|nr:hypothetical protein [Leptolyngbya sp. BL0902]QQE65170.1 hypothetical protein GFS31_18550 [Leptolyngbya sp. BL0902]